MKTKYSVRIGFQAKHSWFRNAGVVVLKGLSGEQADKIVALGNDLRAILWASGNGLLADMFVCEVRT